MDKATYDRGLKIRKSVLGDEFVDKAIASADDFNRPMQDLTTEYCWGYVWGRDGLSHKTRSFLNLAMLCALNRPHELKTHVRGALTRCHARGNTRGVHAGRDLLRRAGRGDASRAWEVFASSIKEQREPIRAEGQMGARDRSNGRPWTCRRRGLASAGAVSSARFGRAKR